MKCMNNQPGFISEVVGEDYTGVMTLTAKMSVKIKTSESPVKHVPCTASCHSFLNRERKETCGYDFLKSDKLKFPVTDVTHHTYSGSQFQVRLL